MADQRHQDRDRQSIQEAGRRASENVTPVGQASADAFQSGAESVQEFMLSGIEMARQLSAQSASQAAKLFGHSGNGAHEAAEKTSWNVEAFIPFGTAMAQRLQDMSRECFEFSQRRLEQNLKHVQNLMHCRTPQDLVAAQTDLWRDNIESLMQSGRKLAELSGRMAEENVRKIAG